MHEFLGKSPQWKTRYRRSHNAVHVKCPSLHVNYNKTSTFCSKSFKGAKGMNFQDKPSNETRDTKRYISLQVPYY